MTEGRVALAALPQADGNSKLRPVLLLKQLPGYGDWLVCGISTQLWQEIAGFDEVILESATDFATSGLKSASVIRLGFLASLPQATFSGEIGQIASDRHRQLLERLAATLKAG